MGNRCLAVEQYRESYQAASVHPAGIPNRAATPQPRGRGQTAPRASREVPASGNAHRQSPCDPEAMMRCLIVDDSPRFLEAARGLLEREGIAVVGVASNSAEALQQAERLRPDVTLVDIDLGGESGLELARRLHREPGLAASRVILISTHAEQDYADLIAASPAIGFVSKAALSAGAIGDLLARGDGSGRGGPVSGSPGR
jgi:CheY-like chemotaxis protein